METFSAFLAICAGNSPGTGEFPAQRPVTRSFDIFFDLRRIKRLTKQSWGWWFEALSCPLWRHSNVMHPPGQNVRHFAFKCIFLNEKFGVSIEFHCSLCPLVFTMSFFNLEPSTFAHFDNIPARFLKIRSVSCRILIWLLFYHSFNDSFNDFIRDFVSTWKHRRNWWDFFVKFIMQM